MHAYRPDHYEALGVPRTADGEAIRAAYRTLAKQLHPDLAESGSDESGVAFQRLQEAYDVLRDPEQRARYDRELARQAAMADAARGPAQRPFPGPMQGPGQRPAPPRTAARTAARAAAPRATMAGRPPLRMRLRGLPLFLAAIGLVVIVTAGIVAWPLLFDSDEPSVIVVKVDPDIRARAARGGAGPAPAPVEPGILAKEADHAVQAQVERVEAARKRMEEERNRLATSKPPAESAARHETSSMRVPRVECIGRGTSIVLTRQTDGTRVSYDNGPQVQPRVSDLSKDTVLVSQIEPTNRFAVAFVKGDRNGTTLLMFDQAGKVQQTFAVQCTMAAF